MNRTLKVIILLIGLLFINIEAAQAGLIQKFKLYIGHEFPGMQPVYILCAAGCLGILTYIILAPMPFKERGKFVGNSYYSQETYQNKRNRIKKISGILNNHPTVN